MIFQFSKNIFLCLIVFLTLCSSAALQAQTNQEIEVSPVKKFNSKNLERLPTVEIDLKGCIQMFGEKSFVIKDKTAFQNEIRKDASRDFCLENFEKFDFEKNSLLGININSGYCRRPVGLEFQTLKDRENKKYTLKISYIDPEDAVCRALSQFDLWVSVPKIPDDFEAAFAIEPKKRE